MTKKEALTIALSAISDTDAKTVIEGMITQLSKPRSTSDEAKAARKEKTAQARAALMEQVLPILRNAITNEGMTAKALFEACADALPADWTANKVQYVLLHEMANEITKTEAKGKPNIYARKSA